MRTDGLTDGRTSDGYRVRRPAAVVCGCRRRAAAAAAAADEKLRPTRGDKRQQQYDAIIALLVQNGQIKGDITSPRKRRPITNASAAAGLACARLRGVTARPRRRGEPGSYRGEPGVCPRRTRATGEKSGRPRHRALRHRVAGSRGCTVGRNIIIMTRRPPCRP